MRFSGHSLGASSIVTTVTLSAAIGLSGCNKSKSSASTTASSSTAPAQTTDQAPSLEGFEGEIGIRIRPGPSVHDAKPIGPLNLQVKGGKIRLDAPTDLEQLKGLGQVYLVVAAPEKRIFAVLEDKKEVVTLALDKLGERIKHMRPPPSHEQPQAVTPKPPPKITKTGHKSRVAGQSCEDWEVSSDGSKAVVCVAERDVPWLKLPTLNIAGEQAWIGELLDGKHFPVRLIAYEKDGRESARIELTKLEQKALPAGLFEMPSGYRTVELEQAIQQVMMAGMGAHSMPSTTPMPGSPANLKYQLPPEIAARLKAAREQAAARQRSK